VAVEKIDRALEMGNDSVRECAAEALQAVVGVEEAHSYVDDLHDTRGAAGLTPPQRHYLTLWWLDAKVRNGGFSQFFFNSTGNLAPYAVAAADAIGAPRVAAIISRTVRLFGPDGPSSDRDTRHAQLAEVSSELLDALSSEYFSCEDNLRVILPLYTARHSEHFRPPRKSFDIPPAGAIV
jgi:hypothetical protein